MSCLTDARQSQRDEAGQRRCLKKAAARRLDRLQDAQALGVRESANQSSYRVPWRSMLIDRLADCDECRQRVTDNRQSEEAEPRLRKAGQFKGQGRDLAPINQAG